MIRPKARITAEVESYQQSATLPLEHGRIVYTTFDAEVLALRHVSADGPMTSGASTHREVEARIVGPGPGALQIQLVYQPNYEAEPLLVADIVFKGFVVWDETTEGYLARIDASAWNRDVANLLSGISTMNALHAGHKLEESSIPSLDIESRSERVAQAITQGC